MGNKKVLEERLHEIVTPLIGHMLYINRIEKQVDKSELYGGEVTAAINKAQNISIGVNVVYGTIAMMYFLFR